MSIELKKQKKFAKKKKKSAKLYSCLYSQSVISRPTSYKINGRMSLKVETMIIIVHANAELDNESI